MREYFQNLHKTFTTSSNAKDCSKASSILTSSCPFLSHPKIIKTNWHFPSNPCNVAPAPTALSQPLAQWSLRTLTESVVLLLLFILQVAFCPEIFLSLLKHSSQFPWYRCSIGFFCLFVSYSYSFCLHIQEQRLLFLFNFSNVWEFPWPLLISTHTTLSATLSVSMAPTVLMC